MEHIDEFMRHKFNSEEPEERFEFREEYWVQAQALIELDEASRKKHRRWLLFWWISGLILLAGAWGFWQTGSALLKEQKRQAPGVELAASGRSSATLALPGANLNKDKNKEKAKKEPEKARRAPSANITQTKESSPEMGAASIAIEGDHKHRISSSKGAVGLLRKAEKAPAGTVLPIPSRNTGLENNMPLTTSTGSKTENNIVATSENLVRGSDTQTVAPSLNKGMNGTAQVKGNLMTIESLPLPMQLLVYQSKLPLPLAKLEVASPAPVKVLNDKRLRFGVETFTSAFIFNQSALGWGGGVGVFAERAFHKNLSLTGGIRYRYVPKSDAIQSSDQEDYKSEVRYSFGAQFIRQKKNVTGFHLVEIPFGLQWHSGRLTFTAFGAPEIVLGAFGKVSQSRTSALSLTADYDNSSNDLYFSSDLYRRFSISVGTGVEWQTFGGLSLCAQFQYFGSLVKPAADATKGKGFGNINVGLKYRF